MFTTKHSEVVKEEFGCNNLNFLGFFCFWKAACRYRIRVWLMSKKLTWCLRYKHMVVGVGWSLMMFLYISTKPLLVLQFTRNVFLVFLGLLTTFWCNYDNLIQFKSIIIMVINVFSFFFNYNNYNHYCYCYYRAVLLLSLLSAKPTLYLFCRPFLPFALVFFYVVKWSNKKHITYTYSKKCMILLMVNLCAKFLY